MAALLALAAALGCSADDAGVIEGAALPPGVVAARAARQAVAAVARAAGAAAPSPSGAESQILFGDLHVHTTFSADAFEASLPILTGSGAHPVADACDFARYCADLDFWGLTDHAEFLTPERWRRSQASVRECQARAGDAAAPDLVSFLGWEWTQIGATPDTHYGHKNVVLRELEAARVPLRPVAYGAPLEDRFRVPMSGADMLVELVKRPFLDPLHAPIHLRHLRYTIDTFRVPDCAGDEAASVECREMAATPDELFRKLDTWGGEALVIPHGNAWGLYTPPGTSWDKQLEPGMHDPARQTLIEVHSGHGNSEEHRPWRAVVFDDAGAAICPAPTPGYLPCCWRAGELIRGRCEAEGAECEARVAEARANYLAAGASGHRSVPGVAPEDWLDCGQCRDCFLPAFNLRPGATAQAALATARPSGAGEPERFRFGFIASSDNHSARPGTGYKEYARRQMTDAAGPIDAEWAARLLQPWGDPRATRTRAPSEVQVSSPHAIYESERRASFLSTGALVAVHARAPQGAHDGSPGAASGRGDGSRSRGGDAGVSSSGVAAGARSRDAIWEALLRREVYGTSGPRILLWFDLQEESGERRPMGSQIETQRAPRFSVRAVGAHRQRPGCPDHALHGLTPERLARLCAGECYHPGDERLEIARIEVVRIRPRQSADEAIASLIDDPWLVLPCAGGADGCRVSFEDADFPGRARDTVYYVRAIQQPTDAVNGGGLRCDTGSDPDGAPGDSASCARPQLCHAGYQTPADDDCLAPVEERAWSSPIFVDYRPAGGASTL